MILDDLANHAKERVKNARAVRPLELVKEQALRLPKGNFRFEEALKKPDLSFICEIKRASPSKGIISADFPYLEISGDYEAAGADCISVLTEPKWFLGSDEIFEKVRQTVSCPMIRKDFTVDEYQIYEAKLLGADAVLLICALLPTKTTAAYLEICDTLGITALVETHDEEEITSAVTAGARVIGVNNRNLKNFSVDFENSAKLREHIPHSALFVAESGVSSAGDVKNLRAIGADAVLVGEYLMRSQNRRATLQAMKRAAKEADGEAAGGTGLCRF